VTNSTTNEDTQTTTGLVISRNPADGAEVTHFQITGITNGTLFQNDGATPINSGDFITFAQANAGLRFTPTPNFFGTGSFNVQASLNNTPSGLGGGVATATITVNPIADTPSVTNSTTNEDTQTTTGLVISRNPADGPEVTHFKITNIASGTLFQNDGATAIKSGDFITFAQGNAGLKFTPLPNASANGSFDVQASLSSTDAGLGGGVVTATITVNTVAPVDFGTAPDTAVLIDDPLNPGQKVLVVTGTGRNDDILVQFGPRGTILCRRGCKISVYAASAVGRIVIFGSAGNDTIRVPANLRRPVLILGGAGNDRLIGSGGNDELRGGAGNDILDGGAGDDLLLGESGNDQLLGGAGRDVLIGGLGVDRLLGQNDDDILIGGSTTHDNNAAALNLILAEWRSSDDFNTRIAKLSGSLNRATVIDDKACDTLDGGAGRDWLLDFLLADTIASFNSNPTGGDRRI
jgi:Ca2+-binding RTX toxin-like protein